MPSSFQDLTRLTELIIPSCPNLTSVPELPVNLRELDLKWCSSLIELPSSFQRLTKLESLDLRYCRSLTSIPNCTGLTSLRGACDFEGSDRHRMPTGVGQPNMCGFDSKDCSILQRLPDLSNYSKCRSNVFEHRTKLAQLDLRYCQRFTNVPNCTGLTSLRDACRFNGSNRCLLIALGVGDGRGLDLEDCSKLQRLPELPHNLVHINLDRCSSLIEIPSSIQHLTNLDYLRLNHCTSLTSMPDCSGLMSLQQLHLHGCSKLERFPEIPNNLLLLIFHGCTSLLEIPSSFQHLRQLGILIFAGCESLTSIPDLKGLQSLKSLVIRSCSKLQRLPELPNSIQDLCLVKLPIEELPPSYEHLYTLLELHLTDCSGLQSPLSIFCVRKSLEILCLQNCPALCALLISRYEDGVVGSLLPPIDFFHNLTKLSLSRCGITEIPDSVCCLTSLQRLELDRNNFERIPESIINLSKLKYLNISYCERLKVLPKLPWANIDARDCTSLQELSYPSFHPGSVVDTPIVRANFINCFKLDQNSLDSFVNAQLEIQAKSRSNVKVHRWDYPNLGICYPGSEIPKQFTFQCSRSFIDVKLPLDYNFQCFALCAVVSFPDQCDAHSESDWSVQYKYYQKSKEWDHLSLHGSSFTECIGSCGPLFLETHSLDCNMRSSQVFIRFGDYFFSRTHDDECTFEFYSCKKDCKVEKCGVHLKVSTHLEVLDESEEVDELYSEESKE